LKPSVVPGNCQLFRAATKRQSVGGRGCGSTGRARFWLKALQDSSGLPRVRLRARGLVQAACDVIAKLGRKRLTASFSRGLCRRRVAGHTPTKTEGGRNPAPPLAQKALDRRRRFALKRLGTRKSGTLHQGPLAACMRFPCGDTRSGSLAKHVNCTPRDGRGTESVNHFSRLPAG
jgi:hypothetical protein